MKAGYRGTKKANFNNIPIKEEKFLELFDTLKDDFTLEELTLANTTLSDYAAGQLAKSLEDNGRLERINLESNNVSPNTLLKIFEVNVLIHLMQGVSVENDKFKTMSMVGLPKLNFLSFMGVRMITRERRKLVYLITVFQYEIKEK